MSETIKEVDQGRRNFLKLAGGIGAAVLLGGGYKLLSKGEVAGDTEKYVADKESGLYLDKETGGIGIIEEKPDVYVPTEKDIGKEIFTDGAFDIKEGREAPRGVGNRGVLLEINEGKETLTGVGKKEWAYDTKGDGKPDFLEIDLTGNQETDLIFMDHDSDGIIDGGVASPGTEVGQKYFEKNPFKPVKIY